MRTELLDLSKVDGCACGGRCVVCNDAATAVGTRVYARVPDRGLPKVERRAVSAEAPLDNPHEPIDPTDEPTPYWPKHFPPIDLPGPKTGGGFPTPWGPEVPPGILGSRVLPSLEWLGCGVFTSSRFRITGGSTGELASLDEIFRQHMTTWEIPNGAFAVVEPTGRLVLARGYTNLDAFTNGEPTFCARPDSVFRLGSISKSFTAAAVMQLVERGRISLRDRVVDLIDLTPLRGHPIDESLRAVRVLHLLTHTGGWDSSALGTTTGFEPTRSDRRIAEALGVGLPIDIDMIIDHMSYLALDFTAGTARQYSNYGYVLAARVVETISGMSLSDYLARNIWDPLDLGTMRAGTSSIADRVAGEVKYYSTDDFGQPEEIQSLSVECGEYPYVCSTLRGDWTPGGALAQWSCLRPYGYRNIANGDGAGTLKGSVIDLARWVWQFSDGGRIASPVLRESNLTRMITDPSPQVANRDGTGQRYGLGWGLPRLSGRSGNSRDVAHAGDMDGTSAYAFVNRTTVPGLCWCYVFNRNIGIDFPPEGAGWGFEDGVLSRFTDSGALAQGRLGVDVDARLASVTDWGTADLFTTYLM